VAKNKVKETFESQVKLEELKYEKEVGAEQQFAIHDRIYDDIETITRNKMTSENIQRQIGYNKRAEDSAIESYTETQKLMISQTPEYRDQLRMVAEAQFNLQRREMDKDNIKRISDSHQKALELEAANTVTQYALANNIEPTDFATISLQLMNDENIPLDQKTIMFESSTDNI
jgi:uncharacterized protein with WD repeat